MTRVEALVALLRSLPLTADELRQLDMALLAEWHKRAGGTEAAPVRL